MNSKQHLGTISINTECNFDPQNPGSIREGINNVLNGFNKQLLIVLGDLNSQKKLKRGGGFKLKLLKSLFKDKIPSKDLIEEIKDSFEKILKIAKELEEPIPSVFGNLINIHESEGGERIFSIGLRRVYAHELIGFKEGGIPIQVVIHQKIKDHVPKALIKMSGEEIEEMN